MTAYIINLFRKDNMGKSIGNFVIKVPDNSQTTFYEDVLNSTKEILNNAPVDNPSKNRQFFISKPMQYEGWIPVFPSLETIGSDNLANLLSKKFNTIAIFLNIYDSDDVFVKIYDSGELIFSYKYVVHSENMKAPEWQGNIDNLFRLFNLDFDKKEVFEQILRGKENIYGGETFYSVDADIQFGKITDFLGLPALQNLQNYGYRYLLKDDTYLEHVKLGILTPTEHIDSN